jgi:hypothetical protein
MLHTTRPVLNRLPPFSDVELIPLDSVRAGETVFELSAQIFGVEASHIVETKRKFWKLVHLLASSHSGESWVRMMSMASLPSAMTTNIAIRKATAVHTRTRM